MPRRVKQRKTCHCGKPSIPGLRRDVALCQYHYNVMQFGKAWADHCEQERAKGAKS